MNVQLKRDALELTVLLIIKKEDQYGYSLVQNTSRYVTIAEGIAYPLLRRLVKSGELNTYCQSSAEGPFRKCYQLAQQEVMGVNQLEEDWKLFMETVEHFIEESESKQIKMIT